MSGAKTPAPSLPWSPAPKGPSIVEAARRVQTDTELVIHDDRLREPSAHGTFPPAPGEPGYAEFWAQDARRTARRQIRRQEGSYGSQVTACTNEVLTLQTLSVGLLLQAHQLSLTRLFYVCPRLLSKGQALQFSLKPCKSSLLLQCGPRLCQCRRKFHLLLQMRRLALRFNVPVHLHPSLISAWVCCLVLLIRASRRATFAPRLRLLR